MPNEMPRLIKNKRSKIKLLMQKLNQLTLIKKLKLLTLNLKSIKI